jgi:hypothetical protein
VSEAHEVLREKSAIRVHKAHKAHQEKKVLPESQGNRVSEGQQVHKAHQEKKV